MSEVARERGRRVGRLTLGGTIARGGMASVHVGRLDGTAGFARRVAIKRLHDANDPQLVAMLLDEARMSACIHHPNVVSTLDAIVENDEVFVVLEYVHGESLARLFARTSARGERLPIPIAAAVVVGALHGLHAAHEAKGEDNQPLEIIHRDVSPQNILMDTNGNARLLDFGVAKARGRQQVSEQGTLKGKVAYMAPEQVHGHVSRASDVFSMGVVLWEALTGERLFQGKSDGEVLAAVMLAKVPLLRSRTEAVPEVFETVVRRSLRRRPEDRFPTARAFADAIEASVAIASTAEVAAWLDREAGDVLAKREQLFPRDEDKPPPAARLRTRVLVALGGVLLVGGVALGVVRASSHAPQEPAPVAATLPAPVEPVDPPAPAAPPASEAPSASSDDPAAAPRRQATRARRCDPPYVLDAKGHKIWKRECF